MARIPSPEDIARRRRGASQELNVQRVIAQKTASRGTSNRTPDEIQIISQQAEQDRLNAALPQPSDYKDQVVEQEFGEEIFEPLDGISLSPFAVFNPTTSIYALDASTGTQKIFNYIDASDVLAQSKNGDWTVGVPAGFPGYADFCIDTVGNAYFVARQGAPRNITKPAATVNSQYTYLSSNCISRLAYGTSSALPRVPQAIVASPWTDAKSTRREFFAFTADSTIDIDPRYRGAAAGANGTTVIYVSNSQRNNIVKIIYTQTVLVNRYPSPSTFTTSCKSMIIAGAGDDDAGPTQSGWGDGAGLRATFNNPTGLCVDIKGNIYVADTNNSRIRKISLVSGTADQITADYEVTTIAGSNTPLALDRPTKVAVDDALNVYVFDATHIKVLKNLETIDNPVYGSSWTQTIARASLPSSGDVLGFTVQLEGANYITDSKNALFFTYANSNNIHKLVYNTITNTIQPVSAFAISNPRTPARSLLALAFPERAPWTENSPVPTPTLTTGVQGVDPTPTPTASRQAPGPTPTNTPTVTQVSVPVLYNIESTTINIMRAVAGRRSVPAQLGNWKWSFTGIANDCTEVFLAYTKDGRNWKSINGTKDNGRTITVESVDMDDAFYLVQVVEANGSRRAVSGTARFNPKRNIFLPAAGVVQTQTPSRSTPTPTATPSPTPGFIRPTPTPTPAAGAGRIVNVTGQAGTNKLTIHYQPWDINSAVYFMIGDSATGAIGGTGPVVPDQQAGGVVGPVTKTSNPKNSSGTIRPITITLTEPYYHVKNLNHLIQMVEVRTSGTIPGTTRLYTSLPVYDTTRWSRSSSVVRFNPYFQTFSATAAFPDASIGENNNP